MFTILGADGKEYGPVTLDQVKSWISDGRANLDTKAKRQGEDVWKRLGDFSEVVGGPAGVPVPPSLGAPPPPAPSGGPTVTVDPKAYADAIISRMQPLQIVSTVERGWNLLKTDFLTILVATFLCMIVMSIALMIPILNFVLGLFLPGIFLGGLANFYLKKIRGQKVEISDVFSGFTIALVPLAVAYFLVTIFTVVGFFLLIIPGIYLAVAYQFTYLLIVDKKLDFWPAMEVSRLVITKQWFQLFLLGLLLWVLNLVGAIALIVGLLVTIPISIAAGVYAYEDLVNAKPKT